MMIRTFRKLCSKNSFITVRLYKRNFLSNEYKCNDAWNSISDSPLLSKINLNDFYNKLDQNYSSKGSISAIDVDIFANALKDSSHLGELKDLLYKLRLSAETGNTLQSTHYATVRNFLRFGYTDELIEILKDPLNYGIFLDDYTANILLSELIIQQNYESAASVAALVMLQEEFNNEITNTLCQYASYKFVTTYTPPKPEPQPEQKPKKVEEIKIRVKFLRNPYFDDHFDIKDIVLLSGKTLAWVSEKSTDNLNNNLQVLGWIFYKKVDKLLVLCEQLSKSNSFKVYSEVLELLNKETNNIEPELKENLEKCSDLLNKVDKVEAKLEDSLKNAIENAINKIQNNDISIQKKLFQSWSEIREQKLEEQTLRLDRARRLQIIEEKQKDMQEEEQKLFFFDNQDQIELQIEEKEKYVDKTETKKKVVKTDENYIPPEILPKRR